jgi:hypothetical protein
MNLLDVIEYTGDQIICVVEFNSILKKWNYMTEESHPRRLREGVGF